MVCLVRALVAAHAFNIRLVTKESSSRPNGPMTNASVRSKRSDRASAAQGRLRDSWSGGSALKDTTGFYH